MPIKTFNTIKREMGIPDHRSKAYERKRMSDPRLALSKKLRSSRRWQKFRDWFKVNHPLCCDPFGHHKKFGMTVPVEQVHHVIGITERPDLLCTESNCRPLCNSCHAKIEGMTRSGTETKHLFKDDKGEYDSI